MNQNGYFFSLLSSVFPSASSANSYHGLRNQGATSYLNSVLQVLFMTKDFREAVTRNPRGAQSIDHHLTTLFDDLKKYPASTYKITSKLGINKEGDAAECFEKILSLTSPEASKIFQGVLTHKCCNCDAETGTDDPFWTLPLELVKSDKTECSVEDAIEKYFSEPGASGPDHHRKTDAAVKTEIRHPEVLTLQLKRFKLDDHSGEYVKIKQDVTFPDTLPIPESQSYELYAFVEHSDELSSGHYTVTIKSQDDDRWYNFKDTSVTLLPNQPFKLDRTHKSSSAYLLFYRKQKMHAAETLTQDASAVSMVTSFQQTKANSYHGLRNQGATSYLNSVLQVLFMTKDFREAVTRNPRGAQSIDHHLTTLFDDLKKYPASTYKITSKLGINKEGDAAECFEKILSLTSPEASKIFQGVLTHKCCNCDAETGTDDPFWTLPLELVKSDKTECSVEDAIEKYFSEPGASGPDHHRKTDAAVKTEIRHPEVLTLQLKRFKLDDHSGEYVKIKQDVTFPDTLQIPESQSYELYAFVEHSDELSCEHYTATIKSQDDDRWYNFNDTSVTLLKSQPFKLDRTHKSSSAYLLFYRKQKMHAAETLTHHVSAVSMVTSFQQTKANSYHGLMNQGATCYLNSVLQVLFMTKDFREAVTRNPRGAQSIDHHLMTLFDDLKKYPAYTYKITSKLGINKVYVQSDAAECFEKILSLTSPEASKIFQGVLTHKNKCCNCDAETGTDDPFWTLPLELVKSDKKECSVEDAIEKHFSETVASGPDQLYCDACNNKSDAAVKTEMTHHPDVLTLLLKRFKFDYRYQEYVKIKQTVTVPDTLQIPESQIYELYAFVEHFGELSSGHYTVTIKSQDDDRWYNFNDTSVTLLSYQPFQLDKNYKSSSSYLLFYKKQKLHAAETLNKGISEDSTAGAPTNKQCEQAVKSGEREEGEEAADMDPKHVDKHENNKKVMNDRGEKDGETGSGKQADEMQNNSLSDLKPKKSNDHQYKQHGLKEEQDEKLSLDKQRDEETRMTDVIMDRPSRDESDRSKKGGNSKTGKHNDPSFNMFQNSVEFKVEQNLSKNNQDQKEEKNKRDDQQAQRQNGTKRRCGESENQILDDSQSAVEEEQGHEVRHKCGEKTGENRHDRRRDQCSFTQTLPGSTGLTENQRRNTDCKQTKLHVQSVIQSDNRLCSVREDRIGGISLVKEDQTMNIQSSSKTQVTAEEVNKLGKSFNELSLNDPPSQELSDQNNQSENNRLSDDGKQKYKEREQALSSISHTVQEHLKEISKNDQDTQMNRDIRQSQPKLVKLPCERRGSEEIIKFIVEKDHQNQGANQQDKTGNQRKDERDEQVSAKKRKEMSEGHCERRKD